MKKCPNCGKISDSKFCPDCGTMMQEMEATPEESVAVEAANTSIADAVQSDAPPVVEAADTSIPDAPQPDAGVTIDVSSPAEDTPQTEATSNATPTIGSTPYTPPEIVTNTAQSTSGKKSIADTLKKKPVIIGIAVLVLILILAGSGGSKEDSSSSSTSDSSDSYSYSDDSSDTDYDYDDDDYDYDSDSDYSSGYSYDDSFSEVQGTWSLIGVVNDGESTAAPTKSLGELVINGDEWEMTLNVSEYTVHSGTLYFDTKGYYDSGDYYNVYTMMSTSGGSVKMAYSHQDDFIVVSTTAGSLDTENCMMFAKY